MQNTNVNGKHKVPFAIRIIKGVGRRFAILVCKIAQIDINRRAGELTEDEMNQISDIFAKPLGKYFASPRKGLPLTLRGCRLRRSKVVLEQTTLHQGWNLRTVDFQHR